MFVILTKCIVKKRKYIVKNTAVHLLQYPTLTKRKQINK